MRDSPPPAGDMSVLGEHELTISEPSSMYVNCYRRDEPARVNEIQGDWSELYGVSGESH